MRKPDDFLPPLHEAVALGDFDAVNALLDGGADINAEGGLGQTPLMSAVSMDGHALVGMKNLFRRIDQQISGKETPKRVDAPPDIAAGLAKMPKFDPAGLMGMQYQRPVNETAPEDDTRMARLLLDRGADVNAASKHGNSALSCAASAGRVETVRLLLDRGAEINTTDRSGRTALMDAAEAGRLEVCQLLLERGADFSIVTVPRPAPASDPDENRLEDLVRFAAPGVDALMCAARGGRVEIARMLVERGMDVNRMTERGSSPLLNAAMFHREEMIAYLREQGAQVGYLEAVVLGDLETARGLPLPAPAERADAWGLPVLHWAIKTGNQEAARLLIERGVRMSRSSPEGARLFMMASLRGDAALMQMLFEAEPVSQSGGEDTGSKAPSPFALPSPLDPMVTAAMHNNLEMARLLISRGANLNGLESAKLGLSPLAAAVMRGNRDMVKLLLEAGADPDGGSHEITPLMNAAMKDDLVTARMLLEAGADPERKSEQGVSLVKGVTFNKPEIKALFEEYALARKQKAAAEREQAGEPEDVEAPDDAGDTALMRAAKHGELDPLRELLAKGANVNARNRFGMTPLMWAVNKRHLEAARLLIESGADVLAVNEHGYSALRIAAASGRCDLVSLLTDAGAKVGTVEAALMGDLETLRQLLDWGADVNAAAEDGTTPLMAAAVKGHVEMAQALLTRGANLHLTDRHGHTALACAAGGNKVEVMRLLLEHGADVNATGPDLIHIEILKQMEERLKAKDLPIPDDLSYQGDPIGSTPLHSAALMGHVEDAIVLLDVGANIEQHGGWRGETPLMKAASGGHLEMARLLLERGADIHAVNRGGETALFWAKLLKKNPELIAYLQEVSVAKDRAGGD